MSAEIVPFGKYKGQPAEALLADSDYCEWLTAQPWFRDRWPNVYNVVINYGTEPQDSPEHNEMQAQFLDDGRCLALADRLGLRPHRGLAAARRALAKDPLIEQFRHHLELVECDMDAGEAEFEVSGWDVVFTVHGAWISRNMTSLPECICRCDHSKCPDHSACKGGDRPYGCYHFNCKRRAIDGKPGKVNTEAACHCVRECPWKNCDTGQWLTRKRNAIYEAVSNSRPVHVELKPDLGDDYPSVLRQINHYPFENGWRCLLVRRAAFEHVTWDQVCKIFAASNITLLTESEITS